MNLSVLYEDNHLIAVNKVSGDLVQGDKTGKTPLNEKVKSYLKTTYNKQGNVFCGVIHRVDQPVSGVVLFAKTSKALTRMNALFREQKVDKSYWAIVKDKPEKQEDTLIHYLRKNSKINKSTASSKEKTGYLRAELNYRLLASSDTYYLLEIKLITGRHHQIRVQLSAIGSPIKGDLKYGFPRSNKDASISLHAKSISFIHPVSLENIHIEAPVPEDKLWMFFEKTIELQ